MTYSKCLFIPILTVLLGLAFHSKAQEKCGTVEYEKIRRHQNLRLENTEQFEKWMKVKIPQFKGKNLNGNRLQAGTYTIPVVVHVMYRFDTGGLENGVVNLINHMAVDHYRHVVLALTEITDFRRRIHRDDVEFISLHKPSG